jgi:hypothetical protein
MRAGEDGGRGGRQDHGEGLAQRLDSSVLATFSHSRRTDATPNAVLISSGQTSR